MFQRKVPSTHQKPRSSKASWGPEVGHPAETGQAGSSQIPDSTQIHCWLAHSPSVFFCFVCSRGPEQSVGRGSVTVSLHWNPEKGRESHHVRSPAAPAGTGRNERWVRAKHLRDLRVSSGHSPADSRWQASQKGPLQDCCHPSCEPLCSQHPLFFVSSVFYFMYGQDQDIAHSLVSKQYAPLKGPWSTTPPPSVCTASIHSFICPVG